MLDIPILSITILIPLISAVYILAFTRNNGATQHIKLVSLFSGVSTLLASLTMLAFFEHKFNDFQFVEEYVLINNIGLDFLVGVDGMSLLLINLMSFLGLLSIIYALHTVKEQLKEFMFFLFMLQAFVIASFAALNLLLFYIFFEIALVPMYMIIGLWGGENKIYASYKFFLYTLVGSVIFAVCIMCIYSHTDTLHIPDLYAISGDIPIEMQRWLWVGMFIAFAIKVPMFPFHTWLPDAHVQAPTVGSVILAGVLLKLGGYGFLRVLLPILPLATVELSIYPLVLSLIAVMYASFTAMAQKDMKKMIAYSSIAHMGYVTGGVFSLNNIGISGSIFQMLSHGLISAALFFSVGSLYERVRTKQIASYGGVATKMPLLAALMMIFTLGSIGLPGTSGFVGEFLCLNGIFKTHYLIASLAVFGVLLSAIYMLGWYKDIMFGTINNKKIESISDITNYERIIFTLLAIMIILLGIFPNMVSILIEPVTQNITTVLHDARF
jgi:NADH-quinone oxidoreductase subunit M